MDDQNSNQDSNLPNFQSSQISSQPPVFNAGSAIPGIGAEALAGANLNSADPATMANPAAPINPGNATNAMNTMAQNPNPIPANQNPQGQGLAAAEDRRPLTFIVIIIITSLVAVTFIGLFIWMYIRWSDVSTDVNGQITEAVALAVDENTKDLESEFTEREKSPYKTFSGPADYGELTFEYPKTWSVYVQSTATNGGDFVAFLHPNEVSTAPYALRVIIENESYDEVAADYADEVEDGELTVSVREVGGSNANVYRGMISDEIQGIFALLKIRDKAAIIQTDAYVFEDDFNRILDTLSYNS